MTAEPNLDRWRHGDRPEPTRLMHVLGHAWPLAADEVGIWALTRDWPLMTEPIAADGDPHADLELELIRAQMYPDLALLHQTSCRVDRDALILNYMAVIRCEGLVLSRWPDALPLDPDVYRFVGKPPTHGAAEAPTVRQLDVVTHGLRDVALRGLLDGIGHLTFLMSPLGDAEIAAALDHHWRRHLADWEPVLYAMYSDRHVPESA